MSPFLQYSFPAVRTDSTRRTHFTTTYFDLQLPASSPTQQMHSGTGNWERIEGKWLSYFQPQSQKNISFLFLMPEHNVHQPWGWSKKGGGHLTAYIFWPHSLESDWTECIYVSMNLHVLLFMGSLLTLCNSGWIYIFLNKARKFSFFCFCSHFGLCCSSNHGFKASIVVLKVKLISLFLMCPLVAILKITFPLGI